MAVRHVHMPGDAAQTTAVPGTCGHDDPASPPVIALSGSCDASTADGLERTLRRSFGPFFFRRHLVLDLRRVTALDEAFCDFALSLARRSQAAGSELVFAGPVGVARYQLARLGLHNLVPVYESPEEARDILRAATQPLIPPRFDPRPALSEGPRGGC